MKPMQEGGNTQKQEKKGGQRNKQGGMENSHGEGEEKLTK